MTNYYLIFKWIYSLIGVFLIIAAAWQESKIRKKNFFILLLMLIILTPIWGYLIIGIIFPNEDLTILKKKD